jgi:hypothetical protein
MFKNKIFIDLIVNNNLLSIPDSFFEKYNLSEYKIITSYKFEGFKYWWHVDYPYNLNYKLKNVNIGILIPLIDFNDNVGSTSYIPKSHLKNNFIDKIDTQSKNSSSQILETQVGDIFIYDGKLVHTGTKNNSTIVRNLISIQFVEKQIPPSEDMKIQYYDLGLRNDKLQKIMTKYHTPGKSNFGSNRNLDNTVYWKLLKYPYRIFKIILKLNLFQIRFIYKLFT